MRSGRIRTSFDACGKALSGEDVEESGPSSARVRITAVSLGQSLRRWAVCSPSAPGRGPSRSRTHR